MSSISIPNLDGFLSELQTVLEPLRCIMPDLSTIPSFAKRLKNHPRYKEGVQQYENAKATQKIAETSSRIAQAAFDEINRTLGPRGSERGSGVKVVPRSIIWKEILQRAEEQRQPPEVIERIQNLLNEAEIAIDHTNLSTRMCYLSLADMRKSFEAAHAAMMRDAKTGGEKVFLQIFLRRVQSDLPTRQ